MSYLKSKSGSIEELVKGMTSYAKEGAYQDMFKKELEKAGKGIGAMTPAEKKAFFNKIDAKYSAKTEELSAAQKKLPPALQKAIKDKEDKKEEVKEDKGYTDQQIKMAYGVANDKRYKAGNYTGAVAAIEKIAKGLSDHPDVQKVLKRTNEDTELDKLKEDVAKMFETHSYMTNKMNKKQMDAKGEETPVKKESMADMWSKSAETIEKIKSEAKYMKSDDESPKEKVGETLVGTKKTKVETEPKVDYQK